MWRFGEVDVRVETEDRDIMIIDTIIVTAIIMTGE